MKGLLESTHYCLQKHLVKVGRQQGGEQKISNDLKALFQFSPELRARSVETISALDIKKLADTPYIAPSPRLSESLVDVVLFMSVVGMLLYLCQRTRPDIAYATAKLTRVT